MLVSNFYRISHILHDRFHKSILIKLIGKWEGDRIVGGALWYIAPPYDLKEAIAFPHRTIFYTAFVCLLCALFAKFWIVISKTTPK
jgi:preprotein translocase subunit SecY